MFSDALKHLFDEFTRSGVRELHIRRPDFELYLSNDPAPRCSEPASVPDLAQPSPTASIETVVPAVAAKTQEIVVTPHSVPADALIVAAPNLGTFYRAPKPGAENYVEVGSKVRTGEELCLIEVMKLFTAVRAEYDGTVHSVLVEDGAMVEGGQALFALVRD